MLNNESSGCRIMKSIYTNEVDGSYRKIPVTIAEDMGRMQRVEWLDVMSNINDSCIRDCRNQRALHRTRIVITRA